MDLMSEFRTPRPEGLRRLLLVMVGYAAGLGLLGLAHIAGLVSGRGALVIALVAVAANAGFFLVFRTGAQERFRDRDLLWPQTLAALAIFATIVYHFDYDRGLALLLSFAVMAIGLFRFATREFMLAAGLVIFTYALTTLVLVLFKPAAVDVQREAFHLLALAVALPPFALFCGRASELVPRPHSKDDEFTTALATIQQMATHDRLTRLPNRAMFVETLSRALAGAERRQHPIAVMFLDLDRFKNVNDTLGHGIGDRILQESANRLQSAMRSGDFVARLGGDEFVMLVEDFRGQAELADIATRILADFKPVFRVDGRSFTLSASIGVCTYPDGAVDPETLVANADIALYRAKEQGRNRFCFYAAELNRLSHERLHLEAGMMRALEADEFEVWFQPKMSIRDGRVKGAEALLRWRHPELGLLLPGRFIPLAEETGLIEALDLWALRRVCERSRRWRESGIEPPPIAVNLSAGQLHRSDLLDALAAVFSETQVSPTAVELEITETTVMRDPERAVEILEGLKGMGVTLSIDDFGMGHSSLGYLKRFPVDLLKIDRTFVKDLPHDRDDVAITRAIIAMAHSLKMSVVAEGVERHDQYDLLRAEGCDQFQGFLCQPALREDDFMRFLTEKQLQQGGKPARRRGYRVPRTSRTL
jgi:diguanylate cyclase (GGDEF)-like protein